MPHTRPIELTEAQYRALQWLAEQRSANLMLLIDLTGEMSADGLEFLRTITTGHNRAIVEFFNTADEAKLKKLTTLDLDKLNLLTSLDDATVKFLKELREIEVENMEYGIRFTVAWRLVWSAVQRGLKWGFAVFVGTALAWEKITEFLKWLKLR